MTVQVRVRTNSREHIKQIKKQLKEKADLAIEEAAKITRQKMKEEMRRVFNVKKSYFLHLASVKIYKRKKDRINSLFAYFKNTNKGKKHLLYSFKGQDIENDNMIIRNIKTKNKKQFKKVIKQLQEKKLIFYRGDTIFAVNSNKTRTILANLQVSLLFRSTRGMGEIERGEIRQARRDHRREVRARIAQQGSLIKIGTRVKKYKHKKSLSIRKIEDFAKELLNSKLRNIRL